MKRKYIVVALLILLVICVSIPAIRYYLAKKAEKEWLSQKPYFTEYHLSCMELSDFIKGFYVDTDPTFYFLWSYVYTAENDPSNWPDYSYFKIEPTEMTDKMVAVLNHDLFDQNYEYDKGGLERAQELGFTTDNRITTDWVISHPKDALYILSGMSRGGARYMNENSSIESWYQDIVNGNEESED